MIRGNSASSKKPFSLWERPAGHQEKHKPYLTIHLRDYAVPGWPSWLGRETHRVNAKTRLRHLEVAGSNPAPGTYLLVSIFMILAYVRSKSLFVTAPQSN